MIFDKPLIYVETRFDTIADISDCLADANKLVEKGIVSLGYGMYCHISPDLFDLSHCPCSDRTSYFEYLLSLKWLACLLVAYKNTGEAKYLDNYNLQVEKFLAVYNNNADFRLLANEELQVSLRNQVFIFSFQFFEPRFKQQMLECIWQSVKWLLEEAPVYQNNHELIKCTAIFRGAAFFANYQFSEDWCARAEKMVRSYFHDCFYKDGVCKEGSLFYFSYNINHFDEIIALCEKYNLADFSDLKQNLDLSKGAFNNFLYSDGSYPLIGDSSLHNDVMYDVNWKDESAVYPDSGMAVLKFNHFALTVKNRYVNSSSHDHADNLSLTLRYMDTNIVIDSGYYNCNRKNPIMQYLISIRSHSGIYPVIFDNITRGEYAECISDAHILDFTENTLTAQYASEKYGLVVKRNVTINDCCVTVTDSWNAGGGT